MQSREFPPRNRKGFRLLGWTQGQSYARHGEEQLASVLSCFRSSRQSLLEKDWKDDY